MPLVALTELRERALAATLGLGFPETSAWEIVDHYLEADRRGRPSHGLSRLPWLAGLADFDPAARPDLVEEREAYQRWESGRAFGYVALAEVVRRQLEAPPERARLVVVHDCFPTGMLGRFARLLAEEGLVALLTSTSPARLSHPDGGPPLTGTNPLAAGFPSSDGRPVVVDVSMGKATYGDVMLGLAPQADLVPFGGEQAHKSFALAVALELLVRSLAGAGGFGAVLVVARPEADPVPAFRTRAAGARLPGDRPAAERALEVSEDLWVWLLERS